MIHLPKPETITDIAEAQRRLVEAAACGEISPEDAQKLGHLLDQQRRTLETIEIEERLAALEEAVGLERA